MRLSAVKWGLYKLKDLFNHIEQGRRLKKDDQRPGNIPFVMSGITNRGVVGYISNPVASFPANSITVDIFGNAFYRNYAFGAGDDTGVYWSDQVTYSEATLLFMAATINESLKGRFDFGHKLRSSQSFDFQIYLPEKSKGKIDFEFIDKFVRELERARLRELERARLRELEAYLVATGLNNYELTVSDKAALNRLSTLQWKPFPITKVFTVRNTHNILASNVKLGSGTTPYLCASAEDNGICGYISYNDDLLEQGNCVFIGGKTFVVSYQKDDFFSNDSHNIALYLKDYAPTRLNQLSLVTCVKKSLGHKYTWGDSVSKAKINKDTIMLPVCADGKTPDLAAMEQIVAAVQKIVIADVAKYTARNLEATQQVIEAQNEPQIEQTITPLIHSEYKPGFIPLYTLRAACGYFGEGRLPEEEGWIDASGLGFTPDPKRHFAVHAKGDSMLPKIKDGDICIFEWYNAGSRNGEIVLTEISEYDDAYDGRYTIKRYHSEKIVTDEGWQHSKVELQPLNPDFDTIELSEDDDVRTIGIFKCVL